VRRISVLLLVALAFSVVPTAGVEAGAPRCRREDLSIKFSINRRNFGPDQPVRMRMRVRNDSGHRCRMVYPMPPEADFAVFRGDNRLWGPNDCYAFPTVVKEETWRAGRTEVYRARWNQKVYREREPYSEEECVEGNHRVRAGRYAAKGYFRGVRRGNTRRISFRLTR
jgi:hypothetical protein